jgi:hypothetical protein
MVCEHLAPLEKYILDSGLKETSRGQAWSSNCREWVYFDVVLDTPTLQERFAFPECVEIHENLDPKSGTERGFYCKQCHDGVMGLLKGERIFR